MNLKKIKYPRYTRKQNLACKLTENDIKKIKQLRKQGFAKITIAKKFKVTSSTICYWILSKDQRIERNKKQYTNSKKVRNDIEDKHQRQNRSCKRKCMIMPDITEYRKQTSKIWYSKNK